jgi:excisionase family DNA binding protein
VGKPSGNAASQAERMDTQKMLLTPVEAATALGIGRSKVYELLRAGALPSVRIGRCRRIPVSGIMEYVATLRP